MEKKICVLVSACLYGAPCRYDGKDNASPLAAALEKMGVTPIPVCPEAAGGLPTPRTPSERKGDSVVSQTGEDMTKAFRKGAETAVKLYRENACIAALLKERSPSCGKGKIYDGTFSRRLKDGNGITAEALLSIGATVFGESEADALIDFIKSKINP